MGLAEIVNTNVGRRINKFLISAFAFSMVELAPMPRKTIDNISNKAYAATMHADTSKSKKEMAERELMEAEKEYYRVLDQYKQECITASDTDIIKEEIKFLTSSSEMLYSYALTDACKYGAEEYDIIKEKTRWYEKASELIGAKDAKVPLTDLQNLAFDLYNRFRDYVDKEDDPFFKKKIGEAVEVSKQNYKKILDVSLKLESGNYTRKVINKPDYLDLYVGKKWRMNGDPFGISYKVIDSENIFGYKGFVVKQSNGYVQGFFRDKEGDIYKYMECPSTKREKFSKPIKLIDIDAKLGDSWFSTTSFGGDNYSFKTAISKKYGNAVYTTSDIYKNGDYVMSETVAYGLDKGIYRDETSGACSTSRSLVYENKYNSTYNKPKQCPTACFIATAAFGDPMNENIQELRDFRDRYLMTNAAGQKLVELYYDISPGIAKKISEHESLKSITRYALMPLIEIAESLNDL